MVWRGWRDSDFRPGGRWMRASSRYLVPGMMHMQPVFRACARALSPTTYTACLDLPGTHCLNASSWSGSTTGLHHRHLSAIGQQTSITPTTTLSSCAAFVEKLHCCIPSTTSPRQSYAPRYPAANIPDSTTHTPLKFLLKPQTRPSAFGYSVNGWLPQLSPA